MPNPVERFEINSEGAKALLRSEEVRADLQRRADAVANAARARAEGVLDHGEGGIVADAYTGKSRAGATVIGIPLDVEHRDHVLGDALDAAKD